MTPVLYILIGIVLGALIGYLFGASKVSEFRTRAVMLEQSLADEKKENAQIIANLKAESERDISMVKLEADEKIATLKSDVMHQSERALYLQQERFNETIAKVEAQMKSATADMLRERQKEFSESSNTSLGQIVNPLRETIDKMKEAMKDSANKQTEMSAVMKENMEHIVRQSEATRKSTEELTRVFKFGNKVQGDWGEQVLNEILQSQGLVPGRHYDVQPTITDEGGNAIRSDEGARMRPDIILHLDENREVIIDSKVSMSAFLDYTNAEDEAMRQHALKLHIESIEKHVAELSRKDYSSYIHPPKTKVDYVIMFMPNTGALWTALNKKPQLWRKAMEKNVYIADEQTLYAALRIIDMTWKQITQARNHEQVYSLAAEMIDRVGQYVKRYEAIGKALDSARKSYDEANLKLAPQGKSIIQTANKLIKLGARQSDKNPIPIEEAEKVEASLIEH